MSTDLVLDMLRTLSDPPTGPAGVATAPPEVIGPAVALPDAAPPPGTDLLTVLRRRRAMRHYAPRPLRAPRLRAAVEAGLAADARHWPGEPECCPLVPVVVALNVDGLPAAAYRFDGAAAYPVMVLDVDFRTLTLQQEFASAGAIVTILGDLAHADAAHGGDGYRRLMVRAGAAAYQMWLAGIDHGLVGSVFAGFLPGAVRAPLRCDGVSRHQLFALALGEPPFSAAAAADGAPNPAQHITEGGESHGKP